MKIGNWLVWLAGVMILMATHGSAAEVGGKPEKAEVTVTYAQASGAFTPIWVANDTGLIYTNTVSMPSFNCSIRRFPLKR